MGTRGLLVVYGHGNNKRKYTRIATMYVMYDAYPDGFMCLLCEYLKDRVIRNGISNTYANINGMDDLASIIVSYMKYLASTWQKEDRPNKTPLIPSGYIYLIPNNTKVRETDADFVYYLYPPEGYEKLYDMSMITTQSPTEWLEIPFMAVRVRAYKYDWHNGKLKLLFNGTMGKYYEKYCVYE